jgi:CDP-diacylglycerol--glycerol-3-phosphate 3-phosphatidyltransferase
MAMYRSVPNQLTVLRLVLAAAFFLVLNQYRFFSKTPGWILLIAIGLFIAAALTDLLDGYLARRWQVESTFGRIMDPFCDKVLVIGAFIYLAGPRFIIPSDVPDGVQQYLELNMVTGVYPWMVALILARELLVTGVRGEMEGGGAQFGANLFGKGKMLLQSITVPVVLALAYWMDPTTEPQQYPWLTWPRDILVYATVLVTVLSGVPYIIQAGRAMRGAQAEASSNDK